MPHLTPQEFVAKWKPMALSERASSQSHFIDLCALLGQPAPTDVDATGEMYTFEKGLTKSTGKQGWADVWKRGCFAWEYKGPGRDLKAAYDQLQRYRESLENPPLLVVSDILTIQVHTNFTNTLKQVHTFTLDDLLDPHKLDLLRNVWTNPEAYHVAQTTAEVTEEAARQFARLSEQLRQRLVEPSVAAHFMIRLLFCLFAEDIGLLPDRLFSSMVENNRTRPQRFNAQLKQLFAVMATGGDFGPIPIPHFNGGLFDNADAVDLDSDGLAILADVAKLDWSAIEPAIIGTLFERSLDPGKRAQLGAHYTSKDDILLIVEPVLMAPLRRRWVEVQAQARELAARRDAEKGGQRTRLHNELTHLLTGFADEIAQMQVLDPASGSGNFLYVSLKQLLDLQKDVVVTAGDLGLTRFFPSVTPAQLHGIEVNEYAHDLAQATIWIGYIQWLRDNGFGSPSEPILKPIESIKHMDAILAYDKDGSPVEPEWPEAQVVVSNPPFLGDKKMRTELGDKYVDDLRRLYEGRVPGGADLVTYWFERSRAAIAAGRVQRAGLLATNSITGGANRRVLERIKGAGDIFMAWRDRPWILDGAAVRVSMVGFDAGVEAERYADGKRVSSINCDLSSAASFTSARRLQENTGTAFLGAFKIGPFDIAEPIARRMLAETGNPNGRPNGDVVHRFVNGLDVTRRSRDMWIIDFGTRSEEDAALYEMPFEYVRRVVKPERDTNRRPRRKRYWWQHGETSPGLYSALANLRRFIATPEVSKHRVFAWIKAGIVPDHQLIVFAREDDYFFGVLHSRLHELWALRMGTSLEDRPRYTPTSTFETFPFPWSPGKEPVNNTKVQAIAQAAKRLVELRDNWLNPPNADAATLKKRTLTNLYNERPTWLQNAHRKLDDAVLDAYGWPHDLSDDQILERLLALNLERATLQGPAQVAEVGECEGESE